MTLTTISLNTGPNYISFPATSTDNFGTILSGISNIIETRDNIRLFYKYDPILLRDWTVVSDFEFIEQGRGYYISVTSPGNITYEGAEYTITFDQLRSRLLKGWNLVGTGSNTLSIPNWCRTIDPVTTLPIIQLEPTRSYWVDYDDCIQPIINPFIVILSISLAVSITSLWLSLRRSKTDRYK